ncbi:glucuronide carrier protein [Halopolyspora algeriensis]|uniref:Glucuronide carrier protein n=1 Tax=Halopolyspora algeriensis TaxID=1500506 RepID=A0A368VRB5_9ACTN|nr:glucuronide transporter [Halopolyspora algeriensis]RCW44482.1 glucuronide carrier protein [Halopolyspora algeriensis]TQM55844.1 glucuronide carrier protein [Halopolyspora algeriensis]
MKLRISQLFGYAAGDAGNNLAFSMASMFLLLYYTDVAGIPAAAAGTIFLVVRIWDGIGDLIAGRLVDKTSSRWGKFRPWLLFGSVPLLLLSVATFHVPDWGLTGKLIYAYVTYAALAMAYSLVNIPYGSLAAAMTQDSIERSKLATARTMGAAAIMLLLAFVISPQVKNAENLQYSLTMTTLVFVVVGVALYLFTFATARETVHRDIEHVSLKQSLITLKRNRPLILLCASSLFFLTAMFSLQKIGIYYARDVLGNANYYIAITVAQIGLMFGLAPFVPKIVRRFGKKNGYIGGALVMIVGSLGVLFAPASMPYVAIGFFVLIGAGLAVVNVLLWSFEADTVEYGEWKTGARTEGATYAVFSFVRKLGQAFGGSAAAYTIGLAGYVGGAQVQSASALWGIRAAAGLVPAVLAGIAIAIMVVYPLTEKRFREITAEVVQRRAERDAEDSQASMPGA